MTTVLDAIAEKIEAGSIDEARQALEETPVTDDNRFDLLFLRGRLKEREYDREGALTTYEQLLEQNPDYSEAKFRAALLADLYGDDTRALELYESSVSDEQADVNTLLNLALIYEENGRLEQAEACLKDVLAQDPNHFRARQFLASVESTATMVYDEQSQRDHERRSAVLDQPITDFELSVRSRNCLKQMNLRTLGDLLKITEAELLSYKNFGETSLNEIKALLAQKGMRLGQALQPAEPVMVPQQAHAADQQQVDAMNLPVSELELSVRSRKCLQSLGVTTVGELITRSESELIMTKNFGLTSLQEIKQQLAQRGMSLRQ